MFKSLFSRELRIFRKPKRVASLFLFVGAVFNAGLAVSAPTTHQSLNCSVGPISRSYGLTDWLVYSCDDEATLVIVSAPGNPALPFMFTLSLENSKHRIHGEGTGNKQSSEAALREIQLLSEADIAALIKQTKMQKKR